MTSEASRTTKHFFIAGKVTLVVIGIWFGLHELKVGGKALFVATGEESLGLKVFIFTGPLSVFPASILLAINLRYGAVWLLAGALASALAWHAGFSGSQEELWGSSTHIFLTHSLPMLGLGVSALLLWAFQPGRAKHEAQQNRQ